MYERKRDQQVFYVILVESIVGESGQAAWVVPIGDKGTIPFAMRQNARDFSTRRLTIKRDPETAADGGTSTVINTWALSWYRERFEK